MTNSNPIMQNPQSSGLLLEYGSRADGNFAEVGVYMGGSAMLLCDVKRDNHIYLFDTFEGNPGGDIHDSSIYDGSYKGDYESVVELLKSYTNVHILKCIFPDVEIEDREYAFVHLDTDTHKGTASGLHYFLPRMVAGGVIVIHDIGLEPVQKAVVDACAFYHKEYKLEECQGVIEL